MVGLRERTGRWKQPCFVFFLFSLFPTPFSVSKIEKFRSLTSGHVTPHGNSPLWPRSAWSRHVSDGDHGTHGTHEHESELFEWHRHPRKVKLRSNSNSPSNKARQGRAQSKQSNSPHRKRYGNSLLPAPHMPEDWCYFRCVFFLVFFCFINLVKLHGVFFLSAPVF